MLAKEGLKLRESDLAEVWQRQCFPAEALSLADGRRLRVLIPGRPGGHSGPDFRDALVEIDGIEHKGDVELHLEAGSFRAHGHHVAPAYSRVVLHVVVWARGEESTLLADGCKVPVAAFGPWLEGRSQEFAAWLGGEFLWREPCDTAPARLGEDTVAETLRAEGAQRLAVKAERLAQASQKLGAEQAFWAALLDILGQGGDRASWRRLAEQVTPALLRTVETEEAALRMLLGNYPGETLNGGTAGRPQNRPELRLRALAEIWRRSQGDLPSFVQMTVSSSANAEQLIARWRVKLTGERSAVLGGGKAQEVILNAVLPFASLTVGLKPQALRLAGQLRALAPYSKTRHLEANLLRPGGGRIVKSALEQQGLLALHGDWCSRGGCGRCPLS